MGDHTAGREGPALDGICELTLETRDRPALERFYRDVFGMRCIDRQADRTWLAVNDRCRLGLWSPGAKEFGDRGGRHVHFAFAAAEGGLDAIRRRLERLDRPGPRVVEHPGGDRSLYVEDPEGNLVEVWDYLERPEGRREGVRGLASSP